MEYTWHDNKLCIKNADNFEPAQVFESGQCFRWMNGTDGYVGVIGGRVVKVKKLQGNILIENVPKGMMDDVLLYFDIGRDYDCIKQKLRSDAYLAKAMEYGSGIRILNQEPFECMISYIISANNRIPQIQRVVNNLSKMYGRQVNFRGKTYYTFPEPDVLADTKVCDVKESRCGFRATYICDAAKRVAWGDLDLNALKKGDYKKAKSKLMEVKGIGPKVADCILLYSLQNYNAFPVDVWVNRVMTDIYIHRKVSLNKVGEFARDKFGHLAGFAQLYLFYYYRNNRGDDNQ